MSFNELVGQWEAKCDLDILKTGIVCNIGNEESGTQVFLFQSRDL